MKRKGGKPIMKRLKKCCVLSYVSIAVLIVGALLSVAGEVSGLEWLQETATYTSATAFFLAVSCSLALPFAVTKTLEDLEKEKKGGDGK